MQEAKFITFEGGEGTGKSTQVKFLVNAFKNQDIPVVVTREPGGSASAEDIRKLLVSGKPDRWQPKTELLLHYAARIENVSNSLKPSLSQGKWIISDRFFDSSFAYQGYGHGIDLLELKAIHNIALGKFKPDLTILLDLPVSEGLARSKSRKTLGDRYEKMGEAFHKRVREGFLKICAAEPDRFIVLDASKPIQEISAKIISFLNKKFQLKLF